MFIQSPLQLTCNVNMVAGHVNVSSASFTGKSDMLQCSKMQNGGGRFQFVLEIVILYLRSRLM